MSFSPPMRHSKFPLHGNLLKSSFATAVGFLMFAARNVRAADTPPGEVTLNVEMLVGNPRFLRCHLAERTWQTFRRT
jgi:hypothetical protein